MYINPLNDPHPMTSLSLNPRYMHSASDRFTYRSFSFKLFEFFMAQNLKFSRVKIRKRWKKARGRKLSQLSEGVLNLIKDHGCMKSFFNISSKKQVLEKVKCRWEQRQHKFLRLNIIYSGVDYEHGKLLLGRGGELSPTFHSAWLVYKSFMWQAKKRRATEKFLPLLKCSKVGGEKAKRRRQENFLNFSLRFKQWFTNLSMWYT